jgi:hypothetical protein
MVKSDISVYYTVRQWGDDAYGGGDRKRECYSDADIPACLFCVFGRDNLGELERHLVKWIEQGRPDKFSIEGRFLKTRDGWLEDLEARPGGGGGEVSREAAEYSQDFLAFFGPRN